MELPGRKYEYKSTLWPYNGDVNEAAIKQQLHFAISTKKLTAMYRTLGHYDKNDSDALCSVTTLQFIAEAVKNTMRLRGTHHGKEWLGRQPRVSVLLTYVTRRVWENEEERSYPYEPKNLLDEANVVGLLFSVLVFDEELSLSDAFSDQIDINRFGMPEFRKKRNQRRRGEDSDDEEEDAEEEGARLDLPGQPLNAPGSRYKFKHSIDGRARVDPRQLYTNSLANAFRAINNNTCYLRLMCLKELGIREEQDTFVAESSDFRLSDLEAASTFRPENAFTLKRALRKLRDWGANEIFTREENWLNGWRSPNDHDRTFGAPYWRAGRMPGSNHHYAAGSVQCMAYYPLQHFNALDLMEMCLPHVKYADADLLQPRQQREKTTVQGQGDSFVLEDFMNSIGLHTVADRMRADKERSRNNDLFNAYFDAFAEIASEMDEMLVDTSAPSREYVQRLGALQRQGYAYYHSIMDPSCAKLPEGYRALQLYIWQRADWTPRYENLWQSAEVAMSPFAQNKVRDLVIDDEIVGVSDNTLLLKARMMRAIYTAYLPRIGKQLNKEHCQIIGTPGTSKSHTLFNVASLLIPGTYADKGGASMMGMIGELKSQRMVTIYQELPNLLAPDGDYKGDADKHLRMKLAQLGDGITEYSTTREVTLPNGDKTREGISTSAEFTDVCIGARNVKLVNATPGGAVEAMYDRFTHIMQRQILPKGRVNLINRVLEAARTESSSGLARVKDQNHLLQRAVMEYGALMSCYAVPLPDLSLFTVLAPLAVGYLAQLRPELHFQLRNISRIKTRMYIEVILHAVRMALTSPLNPSLERDAEGGVHFAPYETEQAMSEIQRYAYSTLDQIVYVLTESMYELTTAESFAITQVFAEKFANYYALGRKRVDAKPDAQRPRWSAAAGAAHMAEIGGLVPGFASVNTFIDRLKREGEYVLGVPTGAHVSRMRQTVGKTGRDAQYSRFELTEVHIEPEYEELFMLNARSSNVFYKLEREALPKYKREWINGSSEYINPNYVEIHGSITEFARLVAGQIGEYQLNEASVGALLRDLQKKTIVTTYLPCVPVASDLKGSLNDVQSLRYIREAMQKFPKYKVPVLINNLNEGEFYLLVSYFETDPYGVVRNMIKHICYEATFKRRTVMGIPSQAHSLYYQPVEIAPEPGKTLVIARKSNINAATLRLLQSYTDGTEIEREQETTRWRDIDIEEHYALEFLRRYNPTTTFDVLETYTPRGIWARLYGPEGYYSSARAREERLLSKPYPEVFLEEPAAPPVEAAVSVPQRQLSAALPPGLNYVRLGKRSVESDESLSKRHKAAPAPDYPADIDFDMF